ncbi:hypothetical protein GE107_16465 [Cohnella sp. CFH 77786]|uniref:hypothetical protein n=1 Tax=Cohnella sp. CFH 77786 TaxID=2662265 RepID=UPI001C610C6C|nr:hypothetical protein [Cohnella sp. CFH 77786]MBW5447652.1 hypothetical protein [Cohnella sp. CFH 77786]
MRIKGILMVFLLVLVAACSSKSVETKDIEMKDVETKVPDVKNCPDAEIDYIDAFMWNDINYVHVGETASIPSPDASKVAKGKEVGEIGYTLTGHACMGYQMQNGDATFLPIGTKVYEAAGYKGSFRLLAGDKLYQANGNPKAKTVSDVYDMKGRVSRVSFESTNDGHLISYFSEEASKEFIDEYLALEYIGFDEIYKMGNGLGDEGKEFLRIHLNDGTSFRISYWTKENLISPGAAGTERLKTITLQQASRR